MIDRDSSAESTLHGDRAVRRNFAEWNWFAGGMLRGCALARERQWIVAWDDASGVYLLDIHGTLVADPVRSPKPLVGIAASDSGDWFVAVCKGGRLIWLDQQLKPKAEMQIPMEPVGFAADPFGDYVAIGGAVGLNYICTRAARKIAEFETTRPMRHLAFIPNTGAVIGASEDGLLTLHDHRGLNLWSLSSRCNVGSLATDYDGATILLAAYGHGIIRYSGAGEREGVYRYEDSPQLVAVDADGSKLLAASLEKHLTEISYDGVIRAQRLLLEKPIALALDPLARYAVLAFANGELRLINVQDFFAGHDASLIGGAASDSVGNAGPTKPVKSPRWETRAAKSNDEVDSAVMDPVPGARLFALYTNTRKLRIFGPEGELHHESNSIPGLGRSIFLRQGWLVAASDCRLVAYDPKTNQSEFWQQPLNELSHVQLFPETGTGVIVEACEFVQSVRFPGSTIWKHRLEYRLESLAVDDAGFVAMTLEDKNLVVFNAHGKPIGKYRARKPEPMQVVAHAGGWLTVARQERVARGHEIDGSLLWATPLPWAPWKVAALGKFIVVASEDGRAALIDETGAITDQSDEPRDNARYFLWDDRLPARLFLVGETLIASAFSGKLLWRHTDEHRIGAYRAGPAGVWVFLGRLLAFFEFE